MKKVVCALYGFIVGCALTQIIYALTFETRYKWLLIGALLVTIIYSVAWLKKIDVFGKKSLTTEDC